MKLNYTTLLIFGALIAALGINSCKNDVEIFAPQSDVTLVYGLLNADDTLHQFKINRVFQGESAISELAQDPTVSEYENISAQVIEMERNGFDTIETGRSWEVKEATITNKDSGFFYYPDQKIYEFSGLLSSNKLYRIKVDKQNETPIVESTTELISKQGNILLSPRGLDFIGLGLANLNGPNEKIGLELKVPVNGKVIQVFLDFTYRNEYNDGTFGPYTTLSYYVGNYVTATIPRTSDQSIKLQGNLNGAAFYEFIAANVPVVTTADNIKQRIPNRDGLDNTPLKFRYVVGGDELNTYIEVAAPSTSILETKPEYTNVTNGVGVFSCRTFQEQDSKMSSASWDYLVEGEITAGRRFCHKSNTHPQSCF